MVVGDKEVSHLAPIEYLIRIDGCLKAIPGNNLISERPSIVIAAGMAYDIWEVALSESLRTSTVIRWAEPAT